jgi:hypothetical protein
VTIVVPGASWRGVSVGALIHTASGRVSRRGDPWTNRAGCTAYAAWRVRYRISRSPPRGRSAQRPASDTAGHCDDAHRCTSRTAPDRSRARVADGGERGLSDERWTAREVVLMRHVRLRHEDGSGVTKRRPQRDEVRQPGGWGSQSSPPSQLPASSTTTHVPFRNRRLGTCLTPPVSLR